MKIKSTKDFASSRVTCLVYSPSGLGKTFLASTLKERTIIISSESGLLSIKNFDIDVIDITKGDSDQILTATQKLMYLEKVLKWLDTNRDYKNVFIDSFSDIASVLVEHLQTKYPDKKDAMKLWGDYNNHIRKMIKDIRDLSYQNVIVTALEKIDKDDIGRRFRFPDMPGAIASGIGQYFDEVFHYRMIEKENTKERMLITAPIDNTLAKDRSGELEIYEKPDLDCIFGKILK